MNIQQCDYEFKKVYFVTFDFDLIYRQSFMSSSTEMVTIFWKLSNKGIWTVLCSQSTIFLQEILQPLIWKDFFSLLTPQKAFNNSLPNRSQEDHPTTLKELWRRWQPLRPSWGPPRGIKVPSFPNYLLFVPCKTNQKTHQYFRKILIFTNLFPCSQTIFTDVPLFPGYKFRV